MMCQPELPTGIARIRICHTRNFGQTKVFADLADCGLPLSLVENSEDFSEFEAVVLIDDGSQAPFLLDNMQQKNGLLFRTIGPEGKGDFDFLIPEGWPKSFVLKAIEAASSALHGELKNQALRKAFEREKQQRTQLTSIGIALSAEKDLDKLLTTILSESRRIACCDAGSLFLVDRKSQPQPYLVFKLAQNDSVTIPFQETRFPMDTHSLSGYVASLGKELNIDDVYNLADSEPYGFNRSFDEATGYRSRSMLVIPMINHHNEIIGVLQFINRKRNHNTILNSPEITKRETLPFSDDIIDLLRALASQASVAIENSILLANIKHLFEGFVRAAVTAIEQRDPTTSGHSFRVADLTTGLIQALPRSGRHRFRNAVFNGSALTEIRYASLLHDFGKVGVREFVLVKAKKLREKVMELIWHRFAIRKEQLKSKSMEKRLAYLLDHGKDDFFGMLPEFDRELQEELREYTTYYQEIFEANEPSILPEGRFNHLTRIRDLPPFDVGEKKVKLLEEEEFMALSVRKGSLTEGERREIESHVTHTFNFLRQIPWTTDLQNIPDYAVAHHEKLNGKGYPNGLLAQNIPLPSKSMTVADIYDALTASDRPYKKALPMEKALDILQFEAKAGLLDQDLVDIFIEAKVFAMTQPDSYKMVVQGKVPEPSHHICDPDDEHRPPS